MGRIGQGFGGEEGLAGVLLYGDEEEDFSILILKEKDGAKECGGWVGWEGVD